jgi:hypothetical protein
MNDRGQLYGANLEGNIGRVNVRAEGGLLVNRVGKSRFMHALRGFMIAWSSSMCTFPEPPKTALFLGAARIDEETGRADSTRGESSLPSLMACLRHNPKELLEWRKMKLCVILSPDEKAASPAT